MIGGKASFRWTPHTVKLNGEVVAKFNSGTIVSCKSLIGEIVTNHERVSVTTYTYIQDGVTSRITNIYTENGE